MKQENENREQVEVSVPLIEKENIDSQMTFELKNEQGVMSEKGDSAFWVKLLGEKGEVVEGKFFASGEGQEKLIVFEPGMPGDSNKWMETRLVPELIRQGYSVFCVRHNGTKVNVENAGNYVNCPERIEKGSGEQDAVLGQMPNKKEFTIEDIANEPRIAVEALQKKFKQIDLIGHSNGVPGIALSLSELSKEVIDKVHGFVGLSGFIGQYDEGKDFFDPKGNFNTKAVRGYYEYCSKFVNLGDLDKNVELQKRVLKKIYGSALPKNIQLTLVNSPKDEYIPVESSQEYRDFVGRGLGITDETQTEADFHDLKNLQPKTLLRLLEMHHPKRKHMVTVKKQK
jgi:hypothetical protein